MDAIKLLIWDVSEILKQLSWRDLTGLIPFFWVFVLYLIPMKKIDARHEMTFLLFTTIFVTFGLTILVPLHYLYERTTRSPISIAMLAILLMLLAFYKWTRMIPVIVIKKEK